jgi:DNA-binding transcriptional MerR regulator
MPIRDMQRFAEVRRQGDTTMGERRKLLESHLHEVIERIAELQRDLTAVTDKIATYQTMRQARDHQHSDP